GDQTPQLEIVIYHQHLFDAMAMQQLFDGLQRGAFLDGHQAVLGRHDFRHPRVETAEEADVTAGDNAHQVFTRNHGQTRNLVGHGNNDQLEYTGIRRVGDRVFHESDLKFLHGKNLSGLLLNIHVLVNNADPTFLSHGNRQTGLGHRIHGGGDQRYTQFNITSQAGFQADVLGQDFGITGNQENIVKGQGFLGDTQH